MKECPIIIFLTYLFQLIVSMLSTQSDIQSLRISAFSALPFWCGGSGFCVGECEGR